MVARCAGPAPVLIFDLDGTLLSINSYPRWARRLARGGFPHLRKSRRVALAVRATAVLAARKFKLMGHEEAKWRLQALWQAATCDDEGSSEAALREELMIFVRPEFEQILPAVRSGTLDAILATAAAAEYACGLGLALGFTHIFASQRPQVAPPSGSAGERKLRAVMAFLEARGWQNRPRILFTDHPDDLPLMRVCAQIYWFGTAAHRRLCEKMAPEGLFNSPYEESFASMVGSLAEFSNAAAPAPSLSTRR